MMLHQRVGNSTHPMWVSLDALFIETGYTVHVYDRKCCMSVSVNDKHMSSHFYKVRKAQYTVRVDHLQCHMTRFHLIIAVLLT